LLLEHLRCSPFEFFLLLHAKFDLMRNLLSIGLSTVMVDGGFRSRTFTMVVGIRTDGKLRLFGRDLSFFQDTLVSSSRHEKAGDTALFIQSKLICQLVRDLAKLLCMRAFNEAKAR
jgi:hypothetical protein